MPTPTLSQLLATLKEKFDQVSTPEQRDCYTQLMLHIATVLGKNLSLSSNYAQQDVDNFFNDLPGYYQNVSQNETVDRLIIYYNTGRCPILLKNIKWTVKSDRQKQKERQQKAKKELDETIANMTRRK